PVLVQGVKRGDVDDIDLRGRVVIVDLKIRKEIRLTRSSRVAISSQGIVGERTVSIDLGPPDAAWPPDSLFPGEFSSGAPEVMGHLEEASDMLKKVTTRIENGEGTLGKLSKDSSAYDELHKAMKDLDELIKDMKANPRKYIKFSVF